VLFTSALIRVLIKRWNADFHGYFVYADFFPVNETYIINNFILNCCQIAWFSFQVLKISLLARIKTIFVLSEILILFSPNPEKYQTPKKASRKHKKENFEFAIGDLYG
jgi:hypothetical protein